MLGGGLNVLIPHHLTHLAKLGPAIAILPQHSLQTCHQHILYKAQICLQLGIRLKFRNKWSKGNSTDEVEVDLRLPALKTLHATRLVSLYNHLTGSVGKRHIANLKDGADRKFPNLFKGRQPYRLKANWQRHRVK